MTISLSFDNQKIILFFYFTKGISSFSFRNFDLRNVELKDCNLENISIQYAYYNEHTSWPEDFDFIHSGALGPGAQLKNKNLSNNVCRNMILTDADLSHVYASGVYFCKARLENSNLTGAMLCNADFHEANFSNCNLSKADLRGCNLQGAQLLGVNLNKARHDQGTIWPDGFRCEEHVLLGERGDYRGLDFSHEDLSHLVLSQGDFQYVLHPQDRHRPGLLGQVSFLALHGHSVSTSATIRGSAVRSILLCQEIPPAPVDVDTSIPEASGETLTLRDRVAEHLENDSCASCHLLMDPIGLGLENYDSIGRWRERDNGALIDASGDLDGAPFENPTALAHEIANHDNFVWCLSRGLARYANGREESRAERDHLDILEQRLVHHQYQIKPFLLEVVMSPLFLRAGSIEE